MKAQTKALIASVVVIALALSAVSGITYSWWSDTESTDITVTTGYVDVETSDVEVTQAGNKIDVGSQASMPSSLSIEYEDDSTKSSSWTPGSVATLKINGNTSDEIVISYNATFSWSVSAKYRMDVSLGNGWDNVDDGSKPKVTITAVSSNAPTKDDSDVYYAPAVKTGQYTYKVSITLEKGLPMGLKDAKIDIINEITQAGNTAWDGRSISEPQKNAAGEYEIGTAAELAWLANQVNVEKKVFTTNDTFNLTADINLAGYEWTPIGDYANGIPFAGTFNGNNHKILGLNVQTPLGQPNNTASGLFGWAGSQGGSTAEINNIVIDGATISGQYYVGGVVGYLQFGSVTDCTVKNSVITNSYDNTNTERDGAKTGGIVGFIAPNGTGTVVTNNIVENIMLTGVRDIGCIAGVAYGGNVITGNTVSGTNYIIVDQTGIISAEDPNAGDIIGRHLNNLTIDSSNTVSGTVTISAMVCTSAQFNKMLRQQWTDSEIILPSGTYVLSGTEGDVTIAFNGTIRGTSGTILDFSGVTQVSEGGHLLYDRGENLTFNNLELNVGSNNYTGFVCDEITFLNCIIDGQLTLYSQVAVFTDCTFNLTSSEYLWTYGAVSVDISDCTFNTSGKAILIYNENQDKAIRNNSVSVTECTFNATSGAKAGAISNQNCAAIEIDNKGWGVNLTISNNTVDTGNDHFSGEWRIKKYNSDTTVEHPVVVNGQTYTTTAIDGKIMVVDYGSGEGAPGTVTTIDEEAYSSSDI